MRPDESARFGFAIDNTALEAPEPGSVEAAFADADLGLSLADLRQARTEAAGLGPDRLRIQSAYLHTPVLDAFDGILSTPTSTVTDASRKARQAERYRHERILLAGDAAHLFPATGVAINAGMLDAVNLAWKLAADLHGHAPAGLLDTYHDERHLAGARTMLHARAQVALRRGHDVAAEALREVFSELLTDEQPLRRMGALVAGTDIRYPMPGSSHHRLAGTFAPDLTLHTDQGMTSVADLLHPARPILLVLADRPDLRQAAGDWQHRVDLHTAKTDDRPADALLIRPDAHIAWAATIDEPADTAAPALREALTSWFGAP
ncbi:FAD-dependent monooxygenase [Nonomuraea sp. NPDC049269]|uniref:aromatic-ring hydroxylase C-terminal domain-containing protein n=1 Tax=Nonomuraea sp. NPDC049269 TaxID=3364349 RepID=UPI00372353C4